ncbi:MAG: hypothetical protein HKN19_10210 [Halioglobus sp.]|nr:hypothetical protein [Halioglobus sp.]
MPEQYPDHLPIIVGAAQHVNRPGDDFGPDFDSPMDLAAKACTAALQDAGIAAGHVDAIGVVRLFSDTAPAWASPFGGSNNPPESIAQRIGARPRERIYTDAGGTAPLTLMMELCQAIGRGEQDIALITGVEAIANQRRALRAGMEADWHEEHDAPLDNRPYSKRTVSEQEIKSGMTLPAHYYALIENLQASKMGHDLVAHRQHMAQMMAPFSEIAANNPYAQFPTRYSVEDILTIDRGNYPIATPFSKRLIAQDAVNQSAALVITSVGKARELGVAPEQWIFLTAYAEGEERFMSQREDMSRSEAMSRVFSYTLDMAQASPPDMDHIDIYSCFPCAVQAACDVMRLPTDGSVPLTVTGGLPYFGGPGNNYCMHAMVEMAQRVRGTDQRSLVTSNGGQLSKHAAVVFRHRPSPDELVDWGKTDIFRVQPEDLPEVPMAEGADEGTVLTWTVVEKRDKPSLGIVLATTAEGGRFYCTSSDPATTTAMNNASPVGARITTHRDDQYLRFSLAG